MLPRSEWVVKTVLDRRIGASVLLFSVARGVRMGGRVAVLTTQSNLPPPPSPSTSHRRASVAILADSWRVGSGR